MDVGSPLGVAAAPAWPPPGSRLSSDPELPGPAYVVSRVGSRQVVPLLFLPPMFYLTMFRLGRAGVPLSRLVNPGVVSVLVVIELGLAGWGLARHGRSTVVGTSDWVAVRRTFGRRWRQQTFVTVARFSRRPLSRPASGRMTVVTITGPEGGRVSVALGNQDPALEGLVGRLRSVGAVEVDPRALPSTSRGATWAVVALILAGVSMPMAYFLVGPLRLLPRPVAGAFTWSGCRASSAVERERPEIGTPYVTASLRAAAQTWRLVTTRPETAATYAQHTQHPAERLAQLQRDGFLTASDAYLQSPAGAVVAVEMLRFSTQAGAQSYDSYVNRAVCEADWQGRSGPRPTEVYLHRGRAALARWVVGDTLLEVGQTNSTPFATPLEVQAIAAALLP